MSSPNLSSAAIGCVLAGSMASAAVGHPSGLWSGIRRVVVTCAADQAAGDLSDRLCRMVADEVERRSLYPVQRLAQGVAVEESRDVAVMQVRIEQGDGTGPLRLAIATRRALEIDESEGARTQPSVPLPANATAGTAPTRAVVARAVARALPGTAKGEARGRPGPFTRFR
jgi:hypothetical protein